jgi:hypothetical protein
MADKPNCKETEPDEKNTSGKDPDEVAAIEIPVSEPFRITYTEKLPPAPPDLEIHPRRPLPPLPEAKPDTEDPSD